MVVDRGELFLGGGAEISRIFLIKMVIDARR